MERVSEKYPLESKVYETARKTIESKSEYLAKLTKLVKAYLGEKTIESKNDFSPKSVSRKIYNASRLLSARIARAIIQTENLIGLKPFRIDQSNYGDLSILEKRAEIGMEVANYLLELSDFKKILITQFINDANCFGTPIAKISIQEKNNIQYVPYIARISPFNFFVDPSATNLDEARYVFEIIPLPKEKFIHYVKNSDDIDDEIINKIAYTSHLNYTGAEYVDEIRQIRKQTNDNQGEFVILLDCWFKDDPHNKGEYGIYNCLLDYVSGMVIKPINPSPFKHNHFPYVMGQIFPIPESQNAFSMTEALYHLQNEYNRFRNQASTNASLAANVAILLSRGAGINLEALTQNAIGRIIMGNNIGEDAIRQLQFRPMLDQLQAMMAYLENDIQMTSGVSDLMSAVNAPSTARAAEILAAQGQINVDIYVIMLTETFLLPLLKQVWSNIQQFLTTKILTTDGVGVNRYDLEGEFQVYCGDLLVKTRQENIAKQLITVMAMFAQAGIPVDYGYLGRLIAVGLGCSPEQAEKIFTTKGTMIPHQAEKVGAFLGQNIPTEMPIPSSSSQGPELLAGMKLGG